MIQKTAILFFARTANAEAIAKNWSQSSRKNTAIANLLFDQALSTIHYTGIPNVQINESLQTGNNFNEKISNALSQFFQLGFQNAIVVGSDCVELSASDIISAYNKIENDQNTVGPSKDGGSYLFTISKMQFDSKEFKDLSWCTSNLNYELTCFLTNRSRQEVSILETKLDLDQDIKKVKADLIGIKSTLSFILVNLLFLKFFLFSYTGPTISIEKEPDIYRRGPPAILAA